MFRVIYFVSNTEKLAAFYQKAFGARRLERRSRRITRQKSGYR